jgi:hypothetical protein
MWRTPTNEGVRTMSNIKLATLFPRDAHRLMP